MSKIWTPQEELQGSSHIWKVLPKRPRPCGGRFFQQNQMLRLPREPATLLRTCNIYKGMREIMEVKYRKNITFLEARKLVEFSMKDNTFANVSQKTNSINSITNNINYHFDKYRTLIENLMQLVPNDWPKFQEQLRFYTLLKSVKP